MRRWLKEVQLGLTTTRTLCAGLDGQILCRAPDVGKAELLRVLLYLGEVEVQLGMGKRCRLCPVSDE